MNIYKRFGPVREAFFQATLAARRLLPRTTISSFENGSNRIDAILAINLDRQPARWRRLQQEFDRFRIHDGRSLADLAHRMPAIDARDGRETAPNADVDPIYLMRDQLFVQPDARMEECFGLDEPISMTRQEIAVARSHVECWKAIAGGSHDNVLVLEDDVYFVRGAQDIIDRGWQAALVDRKHERTPDLFYFSYKDAGGTAERDDVSAHVFRPVRGLWYLSGYVLSRSGAERLLRAMPVVGPVDLWMNYRFAEFDIAALGRPALLQRLDQGSDNAYSILPYLSRAGTVDAGPEPISASVGATGLVFAWNASDQFDAMSMVLSTLGFRVRSFPCKAPLFAPEAVADADGSAETFDAYVDANVDSSALAEIIRLRPNAKFVIARSDTRDGTDHLPADLALLPPERTLVFLTDSGAENPWKPLCDFIELPMTDHPFPRGTSKDLGLFQKGDDLPDREDITLAVQTLDRSPWVLESTRPWRPRRLPYNLQEGQLPQALLRDDLKNCSPLFLSLTETFPGNMATFGPAGVRYSSVGATFELQEGSGAVRPYTSGSLASRDEFAYGRFEAKIRPAKGAGLITGFFLHRDLPRQEIDVELLGSDPSKMLVNVYFNPGDEGTAMGYGYRGTPYFVDLGFDASAAFHIYAVEWTSDSIRWLVDGVLVHERRSWDPTPIPYLPMRLYANLWSPRSVELAGELDLSSLPAHSGFADIAVYAVGKQTPEPPRVCRRLQLLRRWSHDEQDNEQIRA